jgi:hypothetical protein
MEIGWIHYGFSGAIANFVVWISLSFSCDCYCYCNSNVVSDFHIFLVLWQWVLCNFYCTIHLMRVL